MLDTLHAEFGNPEAARNNVRILNQIKQAVESFTENGDSLEQSFKSWNSGIETLRNALGKEQSTTAAKKQDLRRDIEARTEGTKIAQAALERTEIEEREAQARRLQLASPSQSMNWSGLHVPRCVYSLPIQLRLF
jgi:predicted RNase H-like nuclease (RuvC/YqgF family)